MDYLSRYPKSVFEMELQLAKKEYTPEEIEETMPVLKELNYLNDLEYARSYVLGEVGRRGKSLLKVRQKLYHK
jgi:SOS response regulatory protein OraA/RecX